MKTKKGSFVILISFFLFGAIAAQDCRYYSMSKGGVLGYQNLDAKGKVTGSTRITCLDVEKNGAATIYKVLSEYADAKNNIISSRELYWRCEDGKFFVDMQNFVDPKSMEGFKDMEVTINNNEMVYPSDMSTGQTLPDANIQISAGTGGVSLLNLVVNITNRKVIGNETVTVPAGTFECIRITYDVETKLMFKVNSTVTEFVNMGIGNVKTETYDKKGKLLGTTVLNEMK